MAGRGAGRAARLSVRARLRYARAMGAGPASAQIPKESTMREIGHFVGGKEVKGCSGRFGDVFNPNTGEVQARVALAKHAEVEHAIAVAAAAQPSWATTNPQRRARVMFKFLELVNREYDSLAALLSSEHGKTVADSKGDIQRGLEGVEFAGGIPNLLKGEHPTAAGPGADLYSLRQPHRGLGGGHGWGGGGGRAGVGAVAGRKKTGDGLRHKLIPRVESLKIGPSSDAQADYGPLVTRAHLDKVKSYVDMGVKEGAKLVVDGRGFKLQGYEHGNFMGGCLFDEVKPDMRIYKEEIVGPVLCVVRGKAYQEAVRLPSEHDYGNGVAIFTRDGDTARDFTARVNVGMVGVNFAVPVPLSYYTFGGWKQSGFGDLNQHGPDAIRFYTKTKTVTARWPSVTKEGADLVIPTMK